MYFVWISVVTKLRIFFHILEQNRNYHRFGGALIGDIERVSNKHVIRFSDYFVVDANNSGRIQSVADQQDLKLKPSPINPLTFRQLRHSFGNLIVAEYVQS